MGSFFYIMSVFFRCRSVSLPFRYLVFWSGQRTLCVSSFVNNISISTLLSSYMYMTLQKSVLRPFLCRSTCACTHARIHVQKWI